MERHEPRPFRFGVHSALAGSLEEWQELARRVEGSGYGVLTVWDHPDPQLAFGPALLAAALATTTLHVGTLVLDNSYRHPALVALEAATLARLTGGRFELGLGAGWRAENYARLGLPFDPPGVRAGRLSESALLIKRLLTEESVTFAGRHYSITDLPGYAIGGQARPPLLIGAGGPRLLGFAAREAEIVSLLPQALPEGGVAVAELANEAMTRKVARLREATPDGAAPPELNTLIQAVAITPDRRGAAGPIAERWGLKVEEVLASPAALIGTAGEIVELLQERRERLGLSYLSIQRAHMDMLAPVVELLAGQ